jgi:hypothetical protein
VSQRKLPGARPNRRPPAGPPSSGTSAGARGALLLGVAVILGIVLLQKFDNDVGTVSTGSGPVTTVANGDATSTTRRVGLTTVPITPTTVRTRAKADVKVVVANGAGVRGLAALTTEALKGLGYATLTPADVTGGNLDKTSIQFVEGYEAEAKEVAIALSQPPTVVTKLASPPVAAAAIEGAHVVVILGVDVSTTTTAVVGGTTTTTRRAGA